VAAAANLESRPVSREGDHGGDVERVGGLDDDRGPAVDRGIVDLADAVIVGLGRGDDPARDRARSASMSGSETAGPEAPEVENGCECHAMLLRS
jgi:hypothetical protein